MSAGAALLGGFIGTLVLTTTLTAASALRITRMDIPFLLGTAWTQDRTRARVLGYALLFAGTTLVNVLLPAVHPRMGTPFSASNATPLLEPPGFMLLNYGRATPVVTVLGHAVYGAIVGVFVAAGGR